jgi:UDP-N-acetylmuramoyl-L-alanyl-D-glutamate--2,6-diaminopimelate ligase
MKLNDLLAGIPVVSASADLNMEISGVSYDSRKTQPGDLFVAITGYAVDGHAFIPKAAAAGAILCPVRARAGERDPLCAGGKFPPRSVCSGCKLVRPSADSMVMTAVTGTNGKTTTTYLLKAILEQEAGAKVGLIGTNQNMIGAQILPTERTTPESFETQRLFAQMRDAGCTHVVMEASSHALFEDRLYGVRYKVGIFTNLTQDHLDFHKTMENLLQRKGHSVPQLRDRRIQRG